MQSIVLNLIASLIFFLLGFFVARIRRWWIWKNRLAKIEQTARENEIAICIRVGSSSNPVKDVERFLTETRPTIKTLLIYNVTAGILDEPQTAQSIVGDVLEGLRAYGEGEVTRIHYFPAGMLAYSSILPAIVSNWEAFVVYHKKSDTYVPLYQIDKELKHQEKRTLKPTKAWDTVSLINSSERALLHAEREATQINRSAGSRPGE
ncbi:MAG: hypothetical protein WBP93_08415 [Pyrinomonadaceae bacterium]